MINSVNRAQSHYKHTINFALTATMNRSALSPLDYLGADFFYLWINLCSIRKFTDDSFWSINVTLRNPCFHFY